MAASLLMAGAVAGPAAAQDLRFDIGNTLACLDRAADSYQQAACIGTAANVCINATGDGGTTVGMGGCISFELEYWDGRLNDSYRRLRSKERADDAFNAGMPGAVSQADALRDMQRAWIPYRDATCDYERSQWGGGTGAGPATLGCLMRLTGEQTLYLEEMEREF